MKNISLPGIWVLSLGLLMVACQPQAVTPTSDLTDARTDHCQVLAEVLENDCGPYLQVEGGKRYYAKDTRGVSLRAGMQVLMSYVPTTSSTDDGSGGCSSGNCGSSSSTSGSSSDSDSSSHSSSDPSENSLENCMARNGVSPARLLCIQVLSTDGSADETTR